MLLLLLLLLFALSTATGIDVVAKSIQNTGGSDAVSLKVAEQYVNAFGKLAKESNTILLPSNIENPAGFVAQAMTIFDGLKTKKEGSKKAKAKVWEDT